MLFLAVLLLPADGPAAVAQSFEGGTLAHYEKALTDGLYVRVLLDTLADRRVRERRLPRSSAIPWPTSWRARQRTWLTIGMIFVLLPFWTSMLVRTYAWMILLGRNGILNRALLETA